MSPSLSLLVLKTHQVELLRVFYEAFGFTFEEEQHGSGPAHFSAQTDCGTVLEIYPLKDTTAVDATTRLGFRVESIERVLKSLPETASARDTPWGRRAVVKDPDGRSVELSE